MSRFLRYALGMLAALCLFSGPAQAQYGSRVGKVVAIDGPSRDYLVLRKGKSVPVTFNMGLLIGDVVSVLAANYSIHILYVDGKEETIAASNSPVRMLPRAQTGRRPENYVRALWDDVTKAHDEGLASHSIRDGRRLALDMPELRSRSARIVAGDRHFMLQWIGGRGPYRVIVRDAQNRSIIDEAGLPTRQLVITSRTTALQPGSYSIEVSTPGTAITGGFTATAQGIPAEKLEAIEPQDAVDAAAALVETGDRTWYYEAYLRLYAGVRTKNELAQALADYLAMGAPAR